jgi:hypothetical protein
VVSAREPGQKRRVHLTVRQSVAFTRTLAAHVQFGTGGNALPLQGEGWSVPEQGFTWSIGQSSRLRIPYIAGTGTLNLEMTLSPMWVEEKVPLQELVLRINGVEYEKEIFDHGYTTMGFPLRDIPSGQGGELDIVCLHPKAAAPADHIGGYDYRRLAIGFHEILLVWQPPEPEFPLRSRPPLPVPHPDMLPEMVRGCTALSAPELIKKFESLGHNCEFGLVQRILQAEPIGLLRFGGIAPKDILRGLEQGFEGIDDPTQITLLTEMNAGTEQYVIRCERYGMQFHSFHATAETPPERMRERMSQHLGLLRRKFVEDMHAGDKIFVLHHPACNSVAQVRPYLNLLREYGPSALLFVTPAQKDSARKRKDASSGSADQIAPDLFQGHIDFMMQQNDPKRISAPAWLSLCANTYRLWRESGGGA